jgi:hypothetical protein
MTVVRTTTTFVRATTTVVRTATKVARSLTRPVHPFMNISDLSNIKDPSTNATTNQCHHKAWSRISNASRRHPLRRPPMGPLPPPIQTMKLQLLTLDPTLLLKPTLDPDPEDNPVLYWSAICSRRILKLAMFKYQHVSNTSTWRKSGRLPTSSVTATPNPIVEIRYQYRTPSLAKTWPKLSIVPNSWIVSNQINLVYFIKLVWNLKIAVSP